ncbi:N-ATPase subunit AtpR [Sphingomonas oryzagri]
MTIATILLFLLLGMAAGALHLAAIARDADWVVRGGPAWTAIGIRIGRMALTALVLLLAARMGWPMLLAVATGWMTARSAMLRRLGPAA